MKIFFKNKEIDIISDPMNQEKPAPKDITKMPKIFGNQFTVNIHAEKKDDYSNCINSMYLFGIGLISAPIGVQDILRKHLENISDRELMAETIESLCSDFPSQTNSWGVSFNLNKSQIIEFVDLCEKASKGLRI